MESSLKACKLTNKRLEALHELGIDDVESLLCYYPIRYEVMIATAFEDWKENEKVTFQAEVVSGVKTYRHGRLTTSSFSVSAYDRIIKITIFNRPWAKNLKLNDVVTIQGIYKGNQRVTATTYDTKPIAAHNAVTPFYSTKEGIQQRTIRDSIRKVYEAVQNEIMDDIPEEMIAAYRLLRKHEALRRIHFPESMRDVKTAQRTLKYEEFLRFFTAIQLVKNADEGIYKAPRIFDDAKVEAVIERLPFKLTKDQKEAVESSLKDLGSTHIMYRLVQGDVGCGKTVVAALTLYATALSGYQAALLAPTEILARQHFASLTSFLKDTDVKIDLLYGGLSAVEKKRILAETENGDIDILVGTHALFQKDVKFHKLGFVAADEQQRFGVEQRAALREKGKQVDMMLLSATPIPRTLASTLFGDMDISTIETMPAGRKDPVTVYISENSFRSVLSDVLHLLELGRQLYVICAAVEENEEYDARNVQDTAAVLAKLFAPKKVGVLFGRMTSEEKQAVMQEFADNRIQVLVSTTVVEVGMNVVNATGMIVYDADRFGLSQLHQLRGRIQRGREQGYCWLLSDSREKKVQERLNVLVKSNNGFEISYEDLRERGPGDILGKRQSGQPDFILGNLVEDTRIINQARKDAVQIAADPENPDYAALLDVVRKRNENNAVYAD